MYLLVLLCLFDVLLVVWFDLYGMFGCLDGIYCFECLLVCVDCALPLVLVVIIVAVCVLLVWFMPINFT